MASLQYRLLLLAIVILVTSQHVRADSPKQTILRINSGVVFHYISVGHQQNSFWYHSFALDYFNFSILDTQIAAPSCPHKTDFSCIDVQKTVLLANRQRRKATDRILQLQQLIKDLMPRPSTRRAKKGLLDFGGTILNGLFGVVTEAQLNEVKLHLNKISREGAVNRNQIIKIKGQLSSLVNMTDTRFKAAFDAIKFNHQDYLTLQSRLIKLQTYEVKLGAYARQAYHFIRYLMVYMDTIMTVEEQTISWLRGINTLMKGYLPAELIPVMSLQRVLASITIELKTQYPDFGLLYDKPSMYYHAKGLVAYTQTANSIVINLKLPLTSCNTQFLIYSVQSIEMPLNSTTSNTTRIINLDPYLAVTLDLEYYTSLSAELFRTCSGEHVMYCTAGIPMRPRSLPSCISALFYDQSDKVLEHCTLAYKTHHDLNSIVQIDDDHVLISTSKTNWQVRCPGSRLIHEQPTNYGLIALPCQCSIESPAFYLPPRISNCKAKTNKLTVYHAINLPVLKALSDPITLKGVTLSHAYEQPQTAKIPPFPVQRGDWSRIMAVESDAEINFNKLAESAAESDKEFYATQADQLFDILQTTSPRDWSVVNSAGVLVSLLINVILLIKVHKLGILVTALQVPKATALPVKVINSTDVLSLSFSKLQEVIEGERTIEAILKFTLLVAILYVTVRYFINDGWRFFGRRLFRRSSISSLVAGRTAELLIEIDSPNGRDQILLSLGQVPCTGWPTAVVHLYRTLVTFKRAFGMVRIDIQYPPEINFQQYLLANIYLITLFRSNLNFLTAPDRPQYRLYLSHDNVCVILAPPIQPEESTSDVLV